MASKSALEAVAAGAAQIEHQRDRPASGASALSASAPQVQYIPAAKRRKVVEVSSTEERQAKGSREPFRLAGKQSKSRGNNGHFAGAAAADVTPEHDLQVEYLDSDGKAVPSYGACGATSEQQLSRTSCEAEASAIFLRLLPYRTTFSTYAKKRWLGREILEVFTKEFTRFDREHYAEKMRSGDIRVNGKSLAELVGGEREDGVRRAATVASKKRKAAKTKASSLAFPSNIEEYIPADNVDEDDSTSSTTSADAECGTINDPGSYVIQNGDHITHVTEIEENIVLNPKNQWFNRYTTAPHHDGEAETTGVEIIHESEDLLVVNKPASFPVHPTGGYKYLTLTGLLEAGRFWRNKNATATATAAGRTSNCSATQASSSPSSSCTASSSPSTAFPSSYGSLHTVHRLDRFTSGVVLLAKTKEKARELQAAFLEKDAETRKEGRGCQQQEQKQQNQKQSTSSENKPKMRLQKTYLCLVRGNLRERIKENCAGGGAGSESVWDAEDVSAYWPEDINSDKNPWVRVHGGMRCANHRQAVHEFVRMAMPASTTSTSATASVKLKLKDELLNGAGAPGAAAAATSTTPSSADEVVFSSPSSEEVAKYSETDFFPVAYARDYDLTLVLAKPKTGRTHQIRVHLQHLGHPIANDPCYNAKYHAERGGKKVQAGGGASEYSSTGASCSSSCSAGASAARAALLGAAKFPDYPLFPGGHYSGIFLHAWEYKFDVVPGVETKTTEPNAGETGEVEMIQTKAANKEQKQNRAWAYETPLPWWVGAQFFPQGTVNMRPHESEYSPRELFQNDLAMALTRFRDSL